MDDWSDRDLKIMANFTKSRVFELMSKMFEQEKARLHEEALTAAPTEGGRMDAHGMGFRHGEFTGMAGLINLPKEAGELLNNEGTSKD